VTASTGQPEPPPSTGHERPQLWGILNVTPDSFSDGGLYSDPEAALTQARRMVAEGAAVIDVGGESTRPGAEPVTPQLECERVLPVVEALAREGIRVSIDTMHASTAAAAVQAGATIVNDVSGGQADAAMFETVAGLRSHYVMMHWRGPSDQWPALSHYRWASHDVSTELLGRWHAALQAGIQPERIWVDPGLGFAKNPEHNWQLLHELNAIASIGARVLVGASRKRFLGALLPDDAPVDDRDLLTAVVSVLAAGRGADALRVHDVRSSARALDVWQAFSTASASAPQHYGSYLATAPSAATASAGAAAAGYAGGGSAGDRITLTGVRAFAHHGVFDHERRDGQAFIIDVVAHLDLRWAAAGDDLASTVHYGVLAEQVVAAVESDPVDLIESVAERIAGVVLQHGAVYRVEVTVHKPQAPITVPFDDVSVTVVRSRS
jgi:dihydropteroate synthase